MKVYEVRQLAHRWVEAVGSHEPGYVGSFFAGSIQHMADEAPWQPLSDVDIFTLVDCEIDGWSEQCKFLHEGIIVESVVFPFNRFHTPEQLLSRVDAINLTAGSIIADPTGRLADLAQLVTQEYGRREWTRARCLKTRDGILSTHLAGMVEGHHLPDKVFDLLEAVMQMAQLPALAQNQNPTVRQCLVASHALLTALGDPGQHEAILTLLGSDRFDAEQAATHLRACMRAFDYATTVIRTPFWGDFDVNQGMRPLANDGGWDLIERGYPREAMWWILFVHTLAQIAIQNDAPETEKAVYLRVYRQMLGDLGLCSDVDFRQRAAYGQQVLSDVMKLIGQKFRLN